MFLNEYKLKLKINLPRPILLIADIGDLSSSLLLHTKNDYFLQNTITRKKINQTYIYS